MIRVPCIFVTAFVPVLMTNLSSAVEIQHFKAGLVCEQNLDSSSIAVTLSWICFETETIYVTGQGECVYDRRNERCTWYGIEFDYTNATADEKILCVSTSTAPRNLGSPTGVSEKNVRETEYEIELEPGDGHQFLPGYSVLRFSQSSGSKVVDETVCSSNGVELFRYRFVEVFPDLDGEELDQVLRRARVRSRNTEN